MTMTIVVTNRLTGERAEYLATTPEDVLLSINEVNAELDMLKQAKRKLEQRSLELWQERMEQAK